MNRIAELYTRHEILPLREPFETAKRRATTSDTVFVRLTTESGVIGLGAATPVKYVTGETVESVVTAVETAGQSILGMPVDHLTALGRTLRDVLPAAPGARAAIEMAAVDAAGRIAGVPGYKLFGGSFRQIETDITIPVVPPDHAARLAAMAFQHGFRIFKMKAGGKSPDEDTARAVAISGAVPGSSLVVDANQGFEPEAAVTFIRGLVSRQVRVQLFEQPVDCSDVDGLAYVTKNSGFPVFADESAHTADDVRHLAKKRAVTGINVKLMKSGLSGALEIADVCKREGLGLMLGCMLEPRVGIAAALHIACSVPESQHFDLDADMLLADESEDGFTRNGAIIAPVDSVGLGVAAQVINQ